MTIAARISLGFIILLLTMLASGLTTFFAFSHIETYVEQVGAHDLAFYSRISALRVDLGNLRRFEKDYFINIATPSERSSYLGKWKDTLDKARGHLQSSQGVSSDPAADGQVAQLATLLDRYQSGFLSVSAHVESGALTTTAAANKEMTTFKDSVHAMEGVMQTLADQSAKAAAALPAQINASAEAAKMMLVGLDISIIIIGTLLAWWIVRSIRRPLEEIGDTSRMLAEQRNLNLAIPAFGNNEIGAVAGSLKSLVDTMAGLVRQSHGYSARLVASADELSTVSGRVTGAMAHQTQATASSSAAIQQVTHSMQSVAENTQSVEQQALATLEEAEKSVALADKAQRDINLIAESIAQTSASIEALTNRSQEIGSIVQVIHGIAEQTNLLALNAAIEAARAGESGRGFAVVADEVRKLAERTSQATAEISSHIQNVQGDTAAAHTSMGQANDRIASGVASAQSMGGALGEIQLHARASVERIGEISRTIQEQSQASSEMARNVEQIAEMNESAHRSVERANELAGALKSLADELNEALNRFSA
jgi:methyl-accepting chemotaxis protein